MALRGGRFFCGCGRAAAGISAWFCNLVVGAGLVYVSLCWGGVSRKRVGPRFRGDFYLPNCRMGT